MSPGPGHQPEPGEPGPSNPGPSDPGPAELGPTDLVPTELGPTDLLVLRALGLGDLLTGVAALQGLRRRFPRHRLLLAAPAAIGEFLRARGVVDEVVVTSGLEPLEVRGSGHLAVDLHGKGPESRRLLADTAPRDLLGFATDGFPGPPWRRHEHEVRRWCRLVAAWDAVCGPEDLRLRPHPETGEQASPVPASPVASGPVLVHPGAAFEARRWPLERWRSVTAALVGQGIDVVVTGTAEEAHLGAALAEVGAVDRCGTLTLDHLAALVGSARLVLCGDTGTAHLATAFATASVVLFGPTPPAWWGPVIDEDLHTVLWHGDPAAEDYVGDPHGTSVDPTLARIGVEEVLTAARTLLARSG